MHTAEVKEMIEAPCAMSVEYFTLRGVEEEGRRRTVMEEEVEPPTPVVVQFFLDMADTERIRKDAEIRELVENTHPPCPSSLCSSLE